MLLAALAAACAVALPGEGQEVFLERLAALEQLGQERRWPDARAGLDALLAEHVGAPHVRAARTRVFQLAARCSFEAGYERPDEDLLLGSDARHRRWDKRCNRLEITYTDSSPRADGASGALGDDVLASAFHPRGFSLRDGVLLHDVPFAGPVRLTIEGLLPPRSRLRTHPPQVVLVVDEALQYSVDFTWPTRYAASVGQWTQGAAYRWRHGQAFHLGTDDTPGVKYDMMWGEPYELQLVVKQHVLAAALQGYSMLSVKKDDARSGQLGFRWCPSVRQVTFSGIVQDDLLEHLAAAHRTQAEQHFFAQAKPSDLLPDWLNR